jgi:hypothetical protein
MLRLPETRSLLHVGSSTTTPLSGGATFTGASVDASNYTTVEVTVISDTASAPNGLRVEHSMNATNWDTVERRSVQAGVPFTESFPVVAQFVRVVYTSGSAQSEFRLQTILKGYASSDRTQHKISTTGVTLSSTDVFGRVRVSNPQTLCDHKFITSAAQNNWAEITSNASYSFTQGSAHVVYTIPQGNNGRVVRQTRRYYQYQPGKSFLILCTGVLEIHGGRSGVTARIGYFDDGNDKTEDTVKSGDGIFWQLDGTTLGVGKRSYVTGSQVDTIVTQADFNTDTLDGNGPSGLTIDPSKRQIFWFAVEWLGVGKVEYGIVGPDGTFVRAHAFKHAGLNDTVPYMGRATLPLRYEITGTPSGGDAVLHQICATVISEGGTVPSGQVFAAANEDDVNINSSGQPETVLLILRLNPSALRKSVCLKELGISSTNRGAIYRLRRWIAPTSEPFTGTSYASVGLSAAEVAKGASSIDTTGSYVIDIGQIDSNGRRVDKSLLSCAGLLTDIQGHTDYLAITALELPDVTSTRVTTSMLWEEVE